LTIQLCPDVIAFAESPATHPDRWVVMNVATRTCLGVRPDAFQVIAAPDDLDAFDGRTFDVWRIWRFSHIDGLLADPSRFQRDSVSWGEPEAVNAAKLRTLLLEQCILVDDLAGYRARFAPKRSLLDRQRFGNYHQQLGQHLMAYARLDPSAWWLNQKFTPDLGAIRRDTLYGAVQDRFLDEWLPTRIGPGTEVLDLGCGAGLIARKMSALGARVLGVDPNAEYIRLATERQVGDERFQVRNLGQPGALDDLPTGSFDLIYMSDALLFYFVPYEVDKPLDVKPLIADLKRLLKPGGQFLSLEPHPVFYLLPWLGAADRPFTVMTDYWTSQWRINPPLARLAKPFLDAGFVISGLEELRADAADTQVDERAARFAAEFPVWLLLEMRAPGANG
jgi:SAM-dependent methyltransferase